MTKKATPTPAAALPQARAPLRQVEPVHSAAPSDRALVAGLTDVQHHAIDLIWEHQQTKGWAEIAALAGVSETTLWRWRQDPTFKAECVKRSRTNLREYIPAAYQVLVQNMLAGKEWAFTKFVELTGEVDMASLKKHLSMWLQICGAAGTPQIRALFAAVEKASQAGMSSPIPKDREVSQAQEDQGVAIEAPPEPVRPAEVLGDV